MTDEYQIRQAAYLGAFDANKEVEELRAKVMAQAKVIEKLRRRLETISGWTDKAFDEGLITKRDIRTMAKDALEELKEKL